MESKFLPPKGLNCHRSLSVSALLNQLLRTWASQLQLSSHLATSFSANVSWKITDHSWTTFLLYISLLIFHSRVCLHHSTERLSLKLQIISTLTNLVVICQAVLIALSGTAEQPLYLDLIQWHSIRFLLAFWQHLGLLYQLFLSLLLPTLKMLLFPTVWPLVFFVFFLPGRLHACMSTG